MTLKTIWEWIKHAVKQNPVTFMLLFTIVIGYGYDFLPIPEGKMQHPYPPDRPHSYWWFGKFVTIYLVGFILQINRFFKTFSRLDKDVAAVYLCVDFVGFLSYYYQGWPEPKFLFVISFLIGVIIVLSLWIWRLVR